MFNAYLGMIILYCLKQINGERTIYSVYHLLKGKKSSQTIQDAYLFNITVLFQAFSFITRTEFDQTVLNCAKQGMLQETVSQHYILTKKGSDWLAQELDAKPIPLSLNGWKNHHLTDLFWERLSILIQVCSNLLHHETKYIPVQKRKETLFWLKGYLSAYGKNRAELAEQLHAQLTACLELNKESDPSVIVLRLSGHNRAGLTRVQAAMQLGTDLGYYHLQFLGFIHYVLDLIKREPDQYRLLYPLITDLHKELPLTKSTARTFELINEGRSLLEIAAIRKLKQSTIEDHIVEMALNIEEFDISRYVDIDKQMVIQKAAELTSSKQLKQIRKYASAADYFEIRLVMAKLGGHIWT
ncbi:helix-turn-helix domain-containing protein [Bacillus sp. V33-4]|uniref:helix-turn-helix domain-containing protein n=1 Tax=Bacillus sp. V33-4 TaxID=2054169 RepID=UPI000C7740CB|nr:helix-turn-helix domain-containing protein [Bacillus sp. V33-4]PLR84592.1 RQC domain-containing protein [Bacillus sp. V33-4]